MQAALQQKHIPTQALVVEKPNGPFVLHDVILDEVRDDEVLVEVKYSGLCHTDLLVQQGLVPLAGFPVILGHEGAGIIRRLGADLKNQSLKVGDRVLLSFSSCMNCSYCAHDQNALCAQMHAINFTGTRIADGSNPASLRDGTRIRSKFFGQSSFSKLAVVSETSIIKCELSNEELAIMAPMGCGYLTGAGTVMTLLKPQKQSTLAILGMGAVGLSALMAAKAIGVKKLIAVDIVDKKLSLAISLGATDTINSATIASLEQTLRQLAKDGVDQIIDTTGLSFMIEEGFRALGHGGSLAIVGASRPGQTVNIDPLDMLRSCKRLVGVVEGASNPATLIPELIRLHHQGLFPIEKLSRTYPFTDIHKAIEDLKMSRIVKPILSWESI